MVLPPNINSATFAAAMDQFRLIVGKEWVFTSDDDLDLYRDSYSPFLGEPEERFASGAVAPADVAEVQAVVRIANAHHIPLYPISTGRNLGYGGAAPSMSGSVVLDLKRMNRIIEVDEKNAFALVEPGVSYFDLYRYIKDRGLKLWIDCPDPGWGSLVGNALDRGGGYTMTQFRNHFDAHCGMEVVLADGSLLRTGMGALPGAETWQQYKPGFGPWIDGIFSQSNFGIVTKMGFWLMPEPEATLRGRIRSFRYQDLERLLEGMTYLENLRVTTGVPDIGAPVLGVTRDLTPDGLPPPPSAELQALIAKAVDGYSPELEQYAQRTRTPYWEIALIFYGPAKMVRAQWEVAREHFADLPDLEFAESPLIEPNFSNETREKNNLHLPYHGVPSLEIFTLVSRTAGNPNPGRGHMSFSPIIPRTAKALIEANRVFNTTLKRLGLPALGALNMPICSWERTFIFIFLLPVTDDVETNKRYRAAIQELITICAAHGWGEYRTAPAYQDAVMATYSFGDHALLRFHERIKDAIDPNGILSPGRYGIWPKALRKGGR